MSKEEKIVGVNATSATEEKNTCDDCQNLIAADGEICPVIKKRIQDAVSAVENSGKLIDIDEFCEEVEKTCENYCEEKDFSKILNASMSFLTSVQTLFDNEIKKHSTEKSKNNSKEQLIIAEFNKDVETVAAIYKKWGANGLAGFLHTMAQSKAAAEEMLTKAVMAPDEAKEILEKHATTSCLFVGSTPNAVIVNSILEGLTENQAEPSQDQTKSESGIAGVGLGIL
jgi:hypothetical protein